ncbi:MAG: RNA-binding cell elongation regulator Jag/EloR [Candidatus Dormibacteraceae bacterium]
MKIAEGRGRTVDEAVDAALVQLGKSRREVDVKVVTESDEETVIEATVLEEKSAPEFSPSSKKDSGDDATVQVQLVVAELLRRMGISCEVKARETPEAIAVDISGRDLGMLIGWRGETLRALQTMSNLLASRHLGPERRIVVDVEHYRQRRESTVREIATRAARQVKVSGDPITLDPMQPFERRAIHLELTEDKDVVTSSIGEEPDRRVVVAPASQPA